MRGIKFDIRAFTLMEMIVVVSLVAIIAAFSIPNFTKSVRKAREQDAAMQLSSITQANRVYFTKNRFYLNSGGATQDLNFINSGLGLNIAANGMTYTYVSDGATFQTNASWDETGTANDFTVRVNGFHWVGTTFKREYPCCGVGSCPSLGACP